MKNIRMVMMSVIAAGAMLSAPAFSEPAKQQETVQKPATMQVADSPAAAAVNINTADAATLAERLNGVGLKKAQAIVSFREQNGPFKSVEDLVNVTGIGEATLEKNKGLISIN